LWQECCFLGNLQEAQNDGWLVSNAALRQLSHVLLTSTAWHIYNSFSIQTPFGLVTLPSRKHGMKLYGKKTTIIQADHSIFS
jgi:hypothetical protein